MALKLTDKEGRVYEAKNGVSIKRDGDVYQVADRKGNVTASLTADSVKESNSGSGSGAGLLILGLITGIGC